MSISISEDDFRKIAAHAAANLPEESCGLVAGIEEPDGRRIVKRVYLVENEDHARDHFTMSPSAQIAAVKDMRANGWKPLGNWHSHPDTPSRPSEEDVRLALDPNASYMILSLQSPSAPNLNSFRIARGEWKWEILEITKKEV